MLIAQITDTHIVCKGEHWLNEPSTQTEKRLAQIVHHLNQLNPSPDLVLLTGDASDNGTRASYDHLKELLSPLKVPLFVIPGNHDNREELLEAFSEFIYMPKEGFIQYVVDDYPISLIALDTHLPGQSRGEICERRFDWLKQTFSQLHKPTLLFMHHPPALIDHKLFDSIRCITPPGFEEYIEAHPSILGIVVGHHHHFGITSYGGKPCFIAPSVAPRHYFAHPEDEHVSALELSDPALTLHKWSATGKGLTSHIIYIKDHVPRIAWSVIQERIKAEG